MAILYTATRPSDTKWPAEKLTSQNLQYNQGEYQYIDGSYVAHGIVGDGDGGAAINAIVEHGETTGNTMWFHFELVTNTYIDRYDGIIYEMYDTNDNLLVRFDLSNDYYYNTSVYGTGNASSPYYRVGKGSVPLPFDMSVTVDGVDTIAKVYLNGQLIQEISTPNPGTIGKPAYTVLLLNDSYHPMSQMIWADEDTRGMKLAEIPLDETGTQTYSDWSGQTKNLFNNNDELYIITNSAPGNKFTSTTGTNGRITNAKFLNRYSVSGQDTGPNEIFFKSDGTKMYMLGDSTANAVHQYTLSTPWDISTVTYDSVSLSVGSEDTTPRGMYITPDGTKMYICGDTNDSVYQYTMSVAWDLSTATYDSVSFSVTTEETAPHGVDFKTDGTKMYIVGSTSDSVHQYTLSTPWDLTTAAYDSVNFSVAAQDTAPYGIRFKSDGTKMYIVGSDGNPANSIHQYTLSTPWDLATATVDSYQFKVYNSVTDIPPPPYETDPSGLYINWDTGRLYVCGWAVDSVDEFKIDNFFNGEREGYEIKTVRVSSRSWRSADASITNFRHMTRVGTTDYDGSTLHTSSDQTRTNYQTEFAVNPATGVAWTFSEVEAAEFGVKTEL